MSALPSPDNPFVAPATCRVCGCHDLRACVGGCSWVEPDLCSRCVDDELGRTLGRVRDVDLTDWAPGEIVGIYGK